MEQTDSENQMIHMRMDQALLGRLDDFRFKHRFESRSEAARWLLKAALDAKFAPQDETKKRKGTR
jgi:metal-responsive CopG/Arc/MetJ family transcriptional regulator